MPGLSRRALRAVMAISLVVGGCTTGAATIAPATTGPTAGSATPALVTAAATATLASSTTPSAVAGTSTPAASASASAGDPKDLLAIVKARGKIVMSTDPEYPPQSSLDPTTHDYIGFDIDVGKEIAKRLGVTIDFYTPTWTILTAGSWNGRWDFSVGSMTITSDRQKVLDFTQPYYFTPAQMTARTDTGITTMDGLAGKTVCVGADTTYLYWLQGTLDFGTQSPQTKAPAGTKATTLPTDRKCPEAWKRGRKDFEGWLSSSTTVEQAITDGLPVVKVGQPVFYEPLAVALDKSGKPHAELLAAIDAIVGQMHADGTLSALSLKWYKVDLTKKTSQ